MTITVGVIGVGYVGNAIAKVYAECGHKILTIDKIKYKSNSNYKDILLADVIFVCVPSPANSDGTCNIDSLITTLKKLKNYKGIIISKTTAPPDVYEELGKQYSNLIHVPEFLTAKNSYHDYKNETSTIIGGSSFKTIQSTWKFLLLGQKKLKISYDCSIKEAAFAKYVENCFLATKVIFMNEMAQLAKASNLSWDTVSFLLFKDSRIGLSHTKVPGPDGKLGFGGECFPKDTAAFLHYAKNLNQNLELLSLSIEKNKIYRNEQN